MACIAGPGREGSLNLEGSSRDPAPAPRRLLPLGKHPVRDARLRNQINRPIECKEWEQP